MFLSIYTIPLKISWLISNEICGIINNWEESEGQDLNVTPGIAHTEPPKFLDGFQWNFMHWKKG